MDEKVSVEITRQGRAGIVAFKAASISNADQITAASGQIKGFIEDNEPEVLIFDFCGVRFFSSQVLGLLLEVRAKLQSYNGEVLISAINPQLHRVFRITNLDKIFSFFPDKESAIRAVNAD